MTDLEFATAISPQIGDLYAQAKAYRTLAPRASLVLTRSVGAECCDRIAEINSRALSKRETIDSRIKELRDLRLINEPVRQLLHAIRVNGNQGAHPESSRIAQERLPDIALVALEDCRSLFYWLWKIARPGEAPPLVEVSEDDPGLRQQMCQRAALDGDAEAQHMLWQIMTDKAKAIYTKTRAEAIKNNYGVIGGGEYAKAAEHAAFWSKQAAESGYAPAMYQRGIFLAVNEDKNESAKGVEMVRSAADLGERDSIAYIGYMHARGDMGFELDYVKARALLETVGSHPIALTELARIHLEGLGVTQNEAKAFELNVLAAEAGFAEGQFAAFHMMVCGQGGPVNDEGSLKWLRMAADQGHLRALITLARILRFKRAKNAPGAASFEDIRLLILRAMPDLNEVKLEMIELLLERGHPDDVLNAGTLLQQCYQIALDERSDEVTRMCLEAAPTVVKELELAILKIEFAPNVPEHTKCIARWVGKLFDKRGFPLAGNIPPEPTILDSAGDGIPFNDDKLLRLGQLMAEKGEIADLVRESTKEKLVENQ